MLAIKFRFLRRWVIFAAAFLVLAMASAVRADEPAVLNQIPAGANGVVVIPNVGAFANKISNAANRLGMVGLSPDLVGFATGSVGITKGFDANGSIAIVLMNSPAAQPGPANADAPPPLVLLLPTSDAKGLLEPFAPQPADAGGISQITSPVGPAFAAVVDNKWVALAPTHELLVAYLGHGDSFAKTASAETRKMFDDSDLVVWVSTEKFAASFGAGKWLDDRHTELEGLLVLMSAANKQDAFTSAVQKQGLTTIFDFASEFLQDSNSSSFTLRLSDTTATIGISGDFKTDNAIGKFIASQPNGGAVRLNGLPGGSFLAAAALNWDSESVASTFGVYAEKLMSNPAIANDPRTAELAKSLDVTKQMLRITHGLKVAWLQPAAGQTSGLMNTALLIDTSDPQKLMGILSDNFSSKLGFVQVVTDNPANGSGPAPQKVTMKLPMRIDRPDKPRDPLSSPQDLLDRVSAPNGLELQLQVVGNQLLVYCGSGGASLDAAVAAAQSGSDALLPTLAPSADPAVSNPVATGYLSVDRCIAFVQSVLNGPSAGAAPASPATADAAPIVASAGVSDATLTLELAVPLSAIAEVEAAASQLNAAPDSPAEEALQLIQTTLADGTFVGPNTHGVLFRNLVKLQMTAVAVLSSDGKDPAAGAKALNAFSAAIDETISRAQNIAGRGTVTPQTKAKCRQLEDKLTEIKSNIQKPGSAQK